MKKIITLLMAAVMATVFCAGCGNTKSTGTDVNVDTVDSEYIKAKGTLVVGITEYEPMDFMKDGKWTGFDAEFAEEVAKLMGVKAEFVVIDWDNKFFELESQAIDCIWNGMTITDEVKMNTACSEPYAKNEQVVVMNKDKVAAYTDTDSMKELTFAVESGSAAESAASELGFAKVTAVKAQSDALMEVQAGSADACIIDITMATSMTGEGTSYENLAQGISLTKEEYGIGFRKGSDMQNIMNGYIDELKENGKLAELSEKYGVAVAD